MTEPKCHATDDQGRRSVVSLTKKRFAMLEQRFRELVNARGLDDDFACALKDAVCEVLAFNPSVPAYTKEELTRRKTELKKKLKDTNMTTYDAYGRAYYESHRKQQNNVEHDVVLA